MDPRADGVGVGRAETRARLRWSWRDKRPATSRRVMHLAQPLGRFLSAISQSEWPAGRPASSTITPTATTVTAAAAAYQSILILAALGRRQRPGQPARYWPFIGRAHVRVSAHEAARN